MLGIHPSDGFNPEMITLGRESRGLTQRELADQIGVTQGQLSKLESGAIQLTVDIAERLSGTLQYPVSFFAQTDRLYGPSVSEFFHRKRASVSARALARIHAQANLRRMHVERLVKSAEVTQRIPRHDLDEFEGDPEEVARAVRAAWQIPRGPVKDVVATIENAGGFVIRQRFETTLVDAVSWWIPGSPPIFLINDALPADRERLTLIHELAHLVMHSEVRPHMEDEADRFAAAFLMPAEDIRAQLAELTMHKLAGLKTYWRVSMQALLMRAEHTRAIEPGKAKYLWAQISKAGYRMREPAELDFPKERAGLLQELVDFHTEELGYSAEELSKLLHLLPSEAVSKYSPRGALTPPKAPLRVLK